MTEQKPAYASIGSPNYATLVSALVLTIVLSSIGGAKGVRIGPIITDGAFFLFPLTYILGDMITEVFGPKAARRAIISGFAGSVFSVIVFAVIIALPHMGDDYGIAKQDALIMTVGPVWQIVLASLVGYGAGQTSNSLVMWLGKKRHLESKLYRRLVSATGVGEAIDTILFCTIAAPVIGITSIHDWAIYTLTGYAWKVIVQLAMIPVTGRIIGWMKRREPTYGSPDAEV